MNPENRARRENKGSPHGNSNRETGSTAQADKKYRSGPGSSQILESIKKMDDVSLLETISYERKRLNDLAQKALENCGNLDVDAVREQNRIVESLLSEALLRRVEGFEEHE